ncbi:MAG: HD-GYP domain-containing protein, partial [Ilumatobacteraceae bacterium]
MRFLVYAAPFLFSVVAAFILSKSIPPAHSLSVAVARLVVIAACSTVVLFGADRVTRRLLPLAALLGLTLVFPDEAPSRFKIAFVAGGTAQLERRLEEYRNTGATEPALAARRLLELVADLSQHDRLTRGHSERVRAYSQMIGEELGLTEAEIDSLRWAALLHDIGKLEIPFEILNKPGALTRDEYEVIKRHPGIGAELAAPLAGWLGQSVRAVGEHHERWDGTGYPNGLRGSDISIAARIVAVADTFDVMTSARSYRKPGTAAEARAELARCAGTQFDVNVVRA